MTEKNIKRASLAELRRQKEQGELHHPANAPEGEDLGPSFWEKARIENPKRTKSVHLKLDPEVFEYFYAAANGKGHLTKMQNVLRAYADAHKAD